MRFFSLIIILTTIISCKTKPDAVPKVEIIMPQGTPWEEKDSCKIIYYYSENDSVLLNAGLKNRGGLSSRYFKHSYRVELEEDFSMNGLKEDDDWIFNANYIDKTFMRHKLSYDLFSDMADGNIAPASKFIRVSLNGKEHGLYVLMEKVNGGFIKRSINDRTKVVALFKEPNIFKDPKLDTNNYRGFYDQKVPDIAKKDFGGELDSLRQFMFYSKDIDFIKGVESWFYLPSVIDWHLLLLLTNNGDGILKNFYIYKLEDESGFSFIPWDYDHAYGRDGNGQRNDFKHMLNPKRAVLIDRLMNIHPTYKSQLTKRYFELRKSGVFTTEGIHKKVFRMEEEIKPYIDSNFKRWPLNGDYYLDDNTFEEELKILLDYFPIRFKQLDKRFEYQE